MNGCRLLKKPRKGTVLSKENATNSKRQSDGNEKEEYRIQRQGDLSSERKGGRMRPMGCLLNPFDEDDSLWIAQNHDRPMPLDPALHTELTKENSPKLTELTL